MIEEKYQNEYRWSEDGNTIEEANFGRLAVQEQIRSLQGQVMTFIDASFPDAIQRSAANKVVSRIFLEKIKHIQKIALEEPYEAVKGEKPSWGTIAHSYSDGHTEQLN